MNIWQLGCLLFFQSLFFVLLLMTINDDKHEILQAIKEAKK